MYNILIILLLMGCAHNSDDIRIMKKRLEKVESQTKWLRYEQENIRCFTVKDICNLVANDYCVKREVPSKCLKKSRSTCWKKHERCIINNYKRWKKKK